MILRIMGVNQDIKIDDRISTKLVILNKQLFRIIDSILSLNEISDDNELLLVINDEMKRLKDRVICVIDFFHYDDIFKSMMSCVLKEIDQMVVTSPSIKEEFEQISSSFKAFIDKIIIDYEFEIEAQKKPKLSSFLKAYGYYLVVENESNILVKFYSLIDMFTSFYSERLLVFINISSIFEEKELEEIKKYLLYKKNHFLFIESTNVDILKTDNMYEIDSDFVLFNT